MFDTKPLLKALGLIFILFFLVAGVGFFDVPVNASGNLIANSSAENGTPDPDNWSEVGWGNNNPTYTLEEEGFDGDKSLKVEITDYESGDARWAFDDVAVEAGVEYVFSVNYRTDSQINIIMDTTLDDGSHQYTWHGSVNPTSDWSEFQYSFVAAFNAQTVNVFLPIASNGYIQTDNYSLSPKPTAPPASGDNLIANNSFETGNEAGWNRTGWGNNSPSYSIVEGAAGDGDYSSLIEIDSYISGDARWSFASVDVEPDTEYQFSVFYQSTIPVSFNMETTKADGSQQYTWHGSLPATNSWTQSEFTWTTASDDTQVNIYIPINGIGTVQTDNYILKKLTTTPPPVTGDFDRALVSIDFDDGWTSSYTNGFAILDEFGFKGTAGITTDYVSNPDIYGDTYMTEANVLDLDARGHDIVSHTLDHPNLTTLTLEEAETQLRDSQIYLENLLGKDVDYFITPYCSITPEVTEIAKTYYPGGIRNCDSIMNTADNYDRFNIKAFPILISTTLQDIDNALEQAKNNKQWLILMYHEVNESGNEYSVTPQTLRDHMQLIVDKNLDVITSQQAIAEIESQF